MPIAADAPETYRRNAKEVEIDGGKFPFRNIDLRHQPKGFLFDGVKPSTFHALEAMITASVISNGLQVSKSGASEICGLQKPSHYSPQLR